MTIIKTNQTPLILEMDLFRVNVEESTGPKWVENIYSGVCAYLDETAGFVITPLKWFLNISGMCSFVSWRGE